MAASLASTSGHAFPVLTMLVLLPALGAVPVALLPRARAEVAKLIAVAASSAAAGLSLWVLADFESGEAGFQLVTNADWIESFGISWHLGIDGISLFLVVLTGILFPLAIAGVPVSGDEKSYYAWMLVLMAGVLGVFLALDLFVFFVFFEITLVPMYMLIGRWGYGNRVYAATKFFLYTMAGSALMLVAILALVWLNQADSGELTFDLVELSRAELSTNAARALFAAFTVAFAVKIPLFPLHTWLPDAHTEAPTAGSVILAGVLLKLGSYGLLRFGFFLFPEAAVWARPALLTLGVVGITYGAVVATMQTDLKRLVAYSSVAHMGFVVIGLAALTAEGVDGSVIQMVNHGISTGALFLLVGMIYERRHTREIASLSGLQKAAPLLAGIFTVVMLSSVGLPGLNGFVGEFLVLQGTFLSGDVWAVVGAAGVILAALYLLWAYQRVFHGPAEDANASVPDLRAREVLLMLPFLGLIIGIGVYPKPILDRIEPSVEAVLAHVASAADYAIEGTECGSQLDADRAAERTEAFEAEEGHGGEPARDGEPVADDRDPGESEAPPCAEPDRDEATTDTDEDGPEDEGSG